MAKKAKKAKKAKTAKTAKTPGRKAPARAAKKKAAVKKAPAKKRAAKGAMRAAGFRPPHKCQETLSGCLMFFPDSNGDYNTPQGGKPVDCSECKYWF